MRRLLLWLDGLGARVSPLPHWASGVLFELVASVLFLLLLAALAVAAAWLV